MDAAENSVPQLRYVAAVARTGSFSAAARACRVSQPTVSAAVAELERRVGATLFRRSARGVELTPAGREVLPQIESVLGALSDSTVPSRRCAPPRASSCASPSRRCSTRAS